MTKIADDLTWVLVLAAAITLIVGGVGIMNSMLANVQARIREIGIRKALGATRREIRLQFLTEAVFLSLTGGIIGTVLGLGLPALDAPAHALPYSRGLASQPPSRWPPRSSSASSSAPSPPTAPPASTPSKPSSTNSLSGSKRRNTDPH